MLNINCKKCTKNSVCKFKNIVEFLDFLTDFPKLFDITCPHASYVDYEEEYFDYIMKEYERNEFFKE